MRSAKRTHDQCADRRQVMTTVEINPSQTDVSQMVDYRIQAPATVALQANWSEYVVRKSR